jgi:ATP-dependent RNA helicase DeaD
LEKYSKHCPNFKIVAVYGGAGIENQKAQIKRGAQIVVATPGRLTDLINRKFINLENVNNVVLDEADEMLNMGFKEDLDFILDAVPNRESIWLFSATMPSEVRSIARTYMSKPQELAVNQEQKTNVNIEHEYYCVKHDDRFYALKRIVDATPGIYGMVFCRTKAEAKEIAEQMIRDGYNSDAIHGDLAQSDRDRVMQRFREKNLQLLIATDVAARGIDVNNVSHVINYGLPDEIEVYTHRSGRTGRAGKTGISLTIIQPKQEFLIKQLEKKLGVSFKKRNVPTGAEICEKQLMHIVNSIRAIEVNEAEIAPFMSKINEALEDLTKEELIKRFASVEFNRFLAYYSKSEDIDNARNAGKVKRYFINLGMLDGLNRKDFRRMLVEEFNIPSKAIKDIDVNRAYLHIEIEDGFIEKVRTGLLSMNFNDRAVRIDESTPRSKPREDYDGGQRKGRSGGSSYERSSTSRYEKSGSRSSSREGGGKSYSRGYEETRKKARY